MKVISGDLEAHNFLKRKLSEESISFVDQVFADSMFPSLNELNGYGYFELSSEFYGRIVDFISKNSRQNDFSIIMENKPKPNRLLIYGLITYSIIISVLLFRYWHLNYINMHSKNYDIEWDFTNTMLTYKEKNTTNIAIRYFDNNYNLNSEKLETYTRGIGPTCVSFDDDEDGFFELNYFYDLEGNYTGMSSDRNKDHVYDLYDIILESGDTIRLIDQNGNGKFELKE